MNARLAVVGYRVGFALLTLLTLGYQFSHAHNSNPDFRTVNFFSFFTVQSNIFAAVILIVAAWLMLSDRDLPWFDLVRGAAVLYMTTTGIVYGLLLSGYQEELQTSLAWVNTVVHRVMPLVMVADWLMNPPRRQIKVRHAAWWLAYPLAFVAYSLIRGPFADWYPYPFLDPDAAGSYVVVALYCIGIAVGIVAVTALIVTIGRTRTRVAIAD